MRIIELPDGYNGHTIKCFIAILDESKNAVMLQVAEHGKQHMFKWCWKDVYEELIKDDG